MSWRDAPLYVEAHDLARWTLERTATRHAASPGLCRAVDRAAVQLVCSVSLALTFPAGRVQHLEDADQAVVCLRVLLRLARDAGLLTGRGLRFASGRLDAVGRMLGGWQRRLARPAPREGVAGP